MSNVPMSNPELMLAHHQPFQFSRGACIRLKSGRVLAFAGKGYSYSDDAGMTWSEPAEGRFVDGTPMALQNLVELSDGVLGATQRRIVPGLHNPLHGQLLFTTSEDMGKSWSDLKPMSNVPLPYGTFQNALMRTSSGRLIQPVYSCLGQGHYHEEDAPFLGGWVDGEFTSTDAHYYDAHMCGSFVLYSDDAGKTWQPNRDGEMIIQLPMGDFAGTAEPSVVEVEPGKLTMMLRTRLGRAFQSWSYDNGETWSRPPPTHLAASNSPVIVTRLPATNHLLVVWNQQSEQDIHGGYIRTRLSAAVSRNGGGIWEFFQNVESIHEERHVEPGPIHQTRPQNGYAVHPGLAARANSFGSNPELNPHYGRWTNHTVCALEDRVLIAYGQRCKVLPLNWFYRGRDPHSSSSLLNKLAAQCPPASRGSY